MILCMHPARGIGHNTLKITSLGVYAAERKNWNIWIKKESAVGCPSVLGRTGGHGTQRNQKWPYSRQGEAGVKLINRQGVMSLWETLSTQQRKARHGQTPEKRKKKPHRFDLASLTKGKKRKIWAQPEVENNMINTLESADLVLCQVLPLAEIQPWH